MNLRAGGDRKSIFTDADPEHSFVCYWVIEPNGLAIPGSVSGNFHAGPLSNFRHAIVVIKDGHFPYFLHDSCPITTVLWQWGSFSPTLLGIRGSSKTGHH